jgi:hypothetical protein
MGKELEQDIEVTEDLDEQPDLDVDDGEEPGAVPEKNRRGDRQFGALRKENRELRERIARMEGRLEAAGQRTPEQPQQFESDQEEFNFKLLKHAQALEAKLKRIEDKEAQAEAEKQNAKLISRATSGLGFGKQAPFAQEHLTLYVRLHPGIDVDDLREYARKLAKQMGLGQGDKEYTDQKKADQNATKRPSASVQPAPPKATGARPPSAQERLQATRDAALARLRAASEK